MKSIVLLSTLAVGLIVATTSFAQTAIPSNTPSNIYDCTRWDISRIQIRIGITSERPNIPAPRRVIAEIAHLHGA